MEYELIKRRPGAIPFGYYADPNDTKVLLPNELELDRLLDAYAFLSKGHSLSEVRDWLVARTGRSIHKSSLHRRYQNFLKNKQKRRIRMPLAATLYDFEPLSKHPV